MMMTAPCSRQGQRPQASERRTARRLFLFTARASGAGLWLRRPKARTDRAPSMRLSMMMTARHIDTAKRATSPDYDERRATAADYRHFRWPSSMKSAGYLRATIMMLTCRCCADVCRARRDTGHTDGGAARDDDGDSGRFIRRRRSGTPSAYARERPS